MKTLIKNLIFLMIAAMFILPANAALQAVGPVNASNGFPTWYKDTNGIALELQTVADAPNFGIAADVDPASAFSQQINFGAESFWWSAEAAIDGTSAGRILLVLATEAAFVTETPADGDQQAFGRIRVRIDNPPVAGTYKITHPFGTETLDAVEVIDPVTGQPELDPNTGQPIIDRIFFTDDAGCLVILGAINNCAATITDPLNPRFGQPFFSLALDGRVGPFLTWDTFNPDPALSDPQLINPANGRRHVGRVDIEHRVVGSPLGTNFFRVEGPANADFFPGTPGIQNVVETDLFAVTGKIAVDTASPVITILGNNPATVLQNSIYTDAGATATDDFDGDITANIQVVGLPIDTATLGAKTITYTVADSAGNNATATRTVNVVGTLPADTTPPVITVIGINPVSVVVGSVYNDAGATALDNVDGDLTASIISTNNVVTSLVGTYTVTYNVTDAAGNIATATRTVNVIESLVGPINPSNGFPTWYKDTNGIALELQTVADAPNFGIAADVDPASAFSQQINFGAESFWWSAEAAIDGTSAGRILLVLATEAAFVTETPADGDQQAFGRIRVRIDNPPVAGTYKITHPFGTETLDAVEVIDPATGQPELDPNTGQPIIDRIFFTDDVGCLVIPGVINNCGATITDPFNPHFGQTYFSLVQESRVKPFLTWDTFSPDPGLSDPQLINPANGRLHVGRVDIEHRVVGSPLGTNFFRVEGPANADFFPGTPGIQNVVQTDLFAVTGKIADVTRVSLPIDPVANTTTASVAASSPSGNVTVTIPSGTRIMDAAGTNLTNLNVTISSITTLPVTAGAALAADQGIVGEIVGLGPAGTVFDPPIQARFNYSSAQLAAAGITAASLKVMFFNTTTNAWEQVPSTVNEQGQFVTASISHFSTFGLIGILSTIVISEARVNTTLTVSGLPPGATVQFILNGGVPVFAVADASGTARYLPLVEGSLEIIAMQNGAVIYRATVTVLPEIIHVLTAITVSPSIATLIPGNTRTFTALPRDQFGNPIAATVSWSSSNTTVGTISSTGVFTARAAGTATITAASGGVSGTATVTVSLRTMTVSEARVNTTLIVSGLPPGAEIEFILNGGVPVFAIADAAGTAKYLPLLEGSLEIIARQNGAIIARATVTVLPEIVIPPTPITVAIEVRDNINPKAQGVIRVAILNPGFDVATIDIPTLRFGQAVVVKNVTEGNNNLLLHFNVQDTGIKCGDTQVTLTGKTKSGQDMVGTASIVTVGCEDNRGRGGGGGSGGGGVTSGEPFDNIEKSESREKALAADMPVTYDFVLTEHGVEQIVVTGSQNENDISIRLEVLKGASKLVTTPAPGKVYKNLNVWAGTKRIKSALIKFKVANSWLESNSLAGSDIKMLRWDSTKWAELVTRETKKDGKYTYFEAVTGAFSHFVVTGLKAEAAAAPPAVAITETPAKPAKPPVAAVPTPKAAGFEIVLAIAAISALYVLWRKRR